MPKEVVRSRREYQSPPPAKELVVGVHWGRDAEYVQVATTLLDSVSGSPVVWEVSGGWFVDLDRRSINDLIRHLRRARDQAFGRDE